ncbi:hypothetical protein CEXT_466811 [Caerostris extrusa]|uniref:Uncharacterized protein n=1 Tax=Caerostris extrusa TaxID=172846 RepID=A0AAV4W1R8_CAEEX|nr:hypothetical protein CEXT_466811 [Caerostris extrusa]
MVHSLQSKTIALQITSRPSHCVLMHLNPLSESICIPPPPYSTNPLVFSYWKTRRNTHSGFKRTAIKSRLTMDEQLRERSRPPLCKVAEQALLVSDYRKRGDTRHRNSKS